MEEFPNDLQTALDKALDFCQQQMSNADVFNSDTLRALTQISAFTAYLRVKGAEYAMMGDRKKSTFVRANVDALEYIINALKYKCKANEGKFLSRVDI